MSDMTNEMRLFDDIGGRLYLTAEERQAFYKAALKEPRNVRTFCHMLYYTGCRISEALQLPFEKVDLSAQHVVLRTLKRRKQHFRAVPLPES